MKKVFKTIGFLTIIALLIYTAYSSYIRYTYLEYFGTNDRYKHSIGYLDPKTTLLNNDFKLCDNGFIDATHHGGVDFAYKGERIAFKNTILDSYKNNHYTNSGYLNFRFIVNCEGKVGRIEIIELDLNLNPTDLNNNMVEQLLKLTINSKNWTFKEIENVPSNYYMYVSYRIENGKIIEILP